MEVDLQYGIIGCGQYLCFVVVLVGIEDVEWVVMWYYYYWQVVFVVVGWQGQEVMQWQFVVCFQCNWFYVGIMVYIDLVVVVDQVIGFVCYCVVYVEIVWV